MKEGIIILPTSLSLRLFLPSNYQSQAVAWLFQLGGLAFDADMQVNDTFWQIEWLISR
jgi:hypothetical protein